MKIKNPSVTLNLFAIAFVVTLNSCATFHPDTCEVSCCELSAKNPPFQFDKSHPSTTIDICACKAWNSSGIEVKKGEKYIFKVTKIIEPWQDGIIKANPHDGWSEDKLFGLFISPLKRSSANWYELVGSIVKKKDDKSNPLDTEEETFVSLDTFEPLDYFSVEKPFEVKVEDEDRHELYFYANDADRRYFNNQGRLQLKITKLNP